MSILPQLKSNATTGYSVQAYYWESKLKCVLMMGQLNIAKDLVTKKLFDIWGEKLINRMIPAQLHFHLLKSIRDTLIVHLLLLSRLSKCPTKKKFKTLEFRHL